MKILNLLLSKYKRLSLNNIQRFEYNPESLVQMIIGTNGSGKSSVMRELSPLPAYHGDYEKGGMKQIVIEHHNKNYRLISDFTQGAKHSFIDLESQENLNPGGTTSVQKQLVKEVFGLTTELFDLLCDNITFTQMPANKRREWVVALSGSDLDYAIGIHNTFKSLHRDTQGAIKHLNGRITDETQKLINEDRLVAIQREIEELVSELNLMMENKVLNTPHHEQVKNKINQLLDGIKVKSESILSFKLEPLYYRQYGQFKEISDVEALQNYFKSEMNIVESERDIYTEEFSHITQIVEALNHSGTKGIEDLKLLNENLKIKYEETKKTLKEFFVDSSVDYVYSQSLEIADSFKETITSIVPNNSTFTQTVKTEVMEKYDKDRDRLAKLLALQDKISQKYQHIHASDQQTCPQCEHTWKPGLHPHEVEALEKKANELEIHITQVRQSIESHQKYLEAFEEYRFSLTRYRRLVESYPLLKPLWNSIQNSGFIYQMPQKCLSIYQIWLDDLCVCLELSQMAQKIKEYQSALDHAESNQKTESNHLIDRMKFLENQIENCTQNIQVYRKQHLKLVDYRKRLVEFESLTQSLENDYEKLHDCLSIYYTAYRNQHLDSCIKVHQIKLSELNQTLSAAKLSSDVVMGIKQDRDNLIQKLEAYKVILDELSPVDGLIAEQLNDFMAGLVSQMNHVIGQIWTYDLEIRPCGLDSGGLDYKFPLIVKNHDLVVPDVSRGSSSQVDVVDFAFKLIVMVYLGLRDYPLYLDELAPTLDEQHRLRIIRYVREFVEGHHCAQMFMISHYNEAFAAFGSAEVVMMDSTNILTIPGKYNTNVKIN